MKLTEGGIELMLNKEECKAVVQVTDIRKLNTTSERYQMLLSDGTFTLHAILPTRNSHLIRNHFIQKGSILRINDFVTHHIQNRTIIIIIELDILLETYDLIGEPVPYPLPPKGDGSTPSIPRPAAPLQPFTNQSGALSGNPQSVSAGSATSGSAPRPNMPGGMRSPETNRNIGYNSSYVGNIDSGRYSSTSAPLYPKAEPGTAVSQPSYQQPPPMFANRGPITKNEAPPRIVPIAALKGQWTIKARVTAKAELRHYNTQRGDHGKVFSFDLVDSDGGEIRASCFNAVADQFYHQIEPGRVYLISKGSLIPAQKALNHLPNDYEIMLESTSIVQPCFEDDMTIPQQ